MIAQQGELRLFGEPQVDAGQCVAVLGGQIERLNHSLSKPGQLVVLVRITKLQIDLASLLLDDELVVLAIIDALRKMI